MKDLSEGKEWVLILKFAIPMLLGNVFQQLYNIVDSIIVGNCLGKEALTAVGASFPIVFVLLSLAIGVGSGATIIISQYFGAKKYDHVKRTIDTINIVLFYASIIIAVIGLLFSESILKLIDLPEESMEMGTTYLTIFLCGAIATFGFNSTSAILRGLGDSKTPLYFMIVSTILNILLDLLFVIVLKWGVAGAAVATVASQCLAFLTAVIYLNKHHEIIQISLFRLKFDIGIFWHSVRIGLPSGLQHMFVALGMTALFRIVNQFGTDTAAAYSVATRIEAFAVMPAMSFSQALSTFVGQNIGANKPERINTGMKSTWVMSSVISLFFTMIVVIFGKYMMRLFTDDLNVIAIGIQYLLIVGFFYITFSTMFTINAVFRGAGDTVVPMFISLFSLWVIRVPIAYYLSAIIGSAGIWWGIPIAWIIGMLFAFFYFLSNRWKNKAVVKHNIA